MKYKTSHMPLKKAKKERFDMPGTVVKCQSGRYMAFYEHRTDILANGNSEREAKKNLKEMYNLIKKNEEKESRENKIQLPPHTVTHKFTEKFAV